MSPKDPVRHNSSLTKFLSGSLPSLSLFSVQHMPAAMLALAELYQTTGGLEVEGREGVLNT